MKLEDYKYQELIDKHEQYKAKFNDLTIEDCFNWTNLKEQMIDMAITMDSEISKYKIDLENRKGKRMWELKALVDDKWKKIHTESTAQWIINTEFRKEDELLVDFKTVMKMVSEKAKIIIEYTNWAKRKMDLDIDYQQNMKSLD